MTTYTVRCADTDSGADLLPPETFETADGAIDRANEMHRETKAHADVTRRVERDGGVNEQQIYHTAS